MPTPKYMTAGASNGATSSHAARRAQEDRETARERFVRALEEIDADEDLIETARKT